MQQPKEADKVSINKVLFVAYHYPPIAISSGYQRTLGFSKYLKDSGWSTSVLTVKNSAYEKWEEKNNKLIPNHVNVIKAWALDTRKQLSIKGRYFNFTSLPDRWQSWIIGGVYRGLLNIKMTKPDVIISTYPIATAHVIGYLLHRITKTPWVADFRDPMAQEDYPKDPRVYKSFLWIEKKIFKHAAKIIFVTRSALEYYKNRYPTADTTRLAVIPNGFDEEVFYKVEKDLETSSKQNSNRLKFIHSGIIYPSERDPSALLKAIAQLKENCTISEENFILSLRATGHDRFIKEMIDKFDIAELVELLPPLPYEQAIKEFMVSDILLLLQADNCDAQIPVKAYEYLRCNKPILALTNPEGETGKLIREHKQHNVVPLNDINEISKAITSIYSEGTMVIESDMKIIKKYSRKETSKDLALLLATLKPNDRL